MVHQGEKLKALRKKLALTGSELAELVGIQLPTLSRAYRSQKLSSKMIKNICSSVGIKDSYFYEESNDLTYLTVYESENVKKSNIEANEESYLDILRRENSALKLEILNLKEEILKLKARVYEVMEEHGAFKK